MRPFSSSDLLDVWERGSGLHALDRGLLALTLVFSDRVGASPADWTLGRRNRALIDLHGLLFGPTLEGWATCARCGERMEFEIDSRDLVSRYPAETDGETVSIKEHIVRLPSSRDLAEAALQADPNAAALWLLEHCRMNKNENMCWSPDDVEQVSEMMADADPMAEIQLALDCPKCGNASNEVLEIVTFLLSNIDATARRLLWEIHAIACQYGWTQGEILSLSP